MIFDPRFLALTAVVFVVFFVTGLVLGWRKKRNE